MLRGIVYLFWLVLNLPARILQMKTDQNVDFTITSILNIAFDFCYHEIKNSCWPRSYSNVSYPTLEIGVLLTIQQLGVCSGTAYC